MLTLPIPYILRKMQLPDINDVLSIDKLSFPTPAKIQLFEHELSENKLAHYQCLLVDERLIGFSGYWLMGDEQHISTIATHPDWRSKGLGELLLLNMLCMAYAQPITMTTLEVRRSNQVAQRLYLKYKFEIAGERPRYYRDTGDDALIMTRTPLDAPYHNWLQVQQDLLFARLVRGKGLGTV